MDAKIAAAIGLGALKKGMEGLKNVFNEYTQIQQQLLRGVQLSAKQQQMIVQAQTKTINELTKEYGLIGQRQTQALKTVGLKTGKGAKQQTIATTLGLVPPPPKPPIVPAKAIASNFATQWNTNIPWDAPFPPPEGVQFPPSKNNQIPLAESIADAMTYKLGFLEKTILSKVYDNLTKNQPISNITPFETRLQQEAAMTVGQYEIPESAKTTRESQYQGMVVGKTRTDFSKRDDGDIWGKEKTPKTPKKKDTDALTGMFKSIGGAAIQAVSMIAIVTAVGQLLTAMFPFQELFTTLTDIFSVYGAIISQSFMPLIEQLYTVMLSPTVLALVEQLSGVFAMLFTAMIPLIEPISQIGIAIMMGMMPAIEALIPFINLLAPAIEQLSPTIALIAELFGNTLATALNLIFPIIEPLVPVITALAQAFGALIALGLGGLILIFEGIGTAWTQYVVPFGASVESFFKGLINGVIGILNAPIAVINSLIPGTDSDLPTIPLIPMATGGLITGPTPILAGEAGPEMIIPLDKVNSGFGGVTINVYGDVTDEKLQTMQRELWIKGVF